MKRVALLLLIAVLNAVAADESFSKISRFAATSRLETGTTKLDPGVSSVNFA